MTLLAIIPARGGSKGLPGKNLMPIAGKPLIAWSIEQALASSSVTEVVVTTDSEDIAAVAREFGASVPFLRPAELATDTAPTEPAMLHALGEMEKLKGRFNQLMLLQPTSPLRLPGTIDNAVVTYFETKADSLLGVVESHAFFWQDNPVRASYDFTNRPRRQDILKSEVRYRETGSVYITDRDFFVQTCNRLCGKVALFKMQENEGWEIDSLADFHLVETLMKLEFIK